MGLLFLDKLRLGVSRRGPNSTVFVVLVFEACGTESYIFTPLDSSL